MKLLKFDGKKSMHELEKGYEKAEKLLNDEDKVERFLQRLEKKVKLVPIAGNTLSNVPVMASLIRNYVKKDYKDIPIGTIIAILSALIYFAAPIDIFSDGIPFLGYFDDAAVVSACLKLVQTDLDEYVKWREENKEESKTEE